MQYILSQEELDALKKDRNRVEITAVKAFADFCREAANSIPIKVKWINNGEPAPWTCIRDHDHDDHYCDLCPARKWCTYPHQRVSK